ncbi:MAG: DUF4350 domain-containing protein [Candidatus Bathyarchaeota archaeon]|nr:DUF4350 domain-containing protein [Candidatus Bathyarchaeota archaeon]
MIFGVILLLCVVIWFYPPVGDFNVENPSWNGLTAFSSQTNATPVTSMDKLPAQSQNTALIIIPYSEYTPAELEQIKNYVESGGTLLVMDDYGSGNQILENLGVNIEFVGKPLLDPLFDYQNKQLPIITDFKNTSQTANVSSVVFNHATSLRILANYTILAYSSGFSFIDENNNQEWDNEETVGAQPVAAYTQIGEGYVVAVADPSVLINSMINLNDNQRFITNLVRIQSSNPKIYLDQTHLINSPLSDAKTSLNLIYSAAASPIGIVCVVAALLAVMLYPFYRRNKND